MKLRSSTLQFNDSLFVLFLRAVSDLFSLLTTIPAHFCIVFLFAGLDKKINIFLLVNHDNNFNNYG